MHSRSDSVHRLLLWCSLKRICIDERLSVVQDEETGEMSVFNLTEEAIPVSQTLVTIPRRWMISIRTCAPSDSLITWLVGNGIHVPVYGHEAQLALALALYNEFLLGSRSEWADYLQSLPQKTVPIGLFWGYKYSEDDSPDREAIDWKSSRDLRQLFVNPETGVERLSVVIADRNSWILRKGCGTVFIVIAVSGGGDFEGVSSRIFSGDLACVSGRWIPRVEHGSHRRQLQSLSPEPDPPRE